jgi:hypothetical protein
VQHWEERVSKPQEVYKSSTMGNIPLSFTGRHLMQSLREAIQDLVRDVHQDGMPTKSNKEAWEPLSRARGRIAQYMSDLEQKNIPAPVAQPEALTEADMVSKLRLKGYDVRKPAPWQFSYEDLQKRNGELDDQLRALKDGMRGLLNGSAAPAPTSAFDGCTSFMGVQSNKIAEVIVAAQKSKALRNKVLGGNVISAKDLDSMHADTLILADVARKLAE